MKSEKNPPAFRAISAPLDVDDAALDRVNGELGVPTLTKPSRVMEAEKPEKSKRAANKPEEACRAVLEKLTIEVPAYLSDAMRRAALDRRTSVRHVVMMALKESGFDIADVDLVADGRRSRGKV